jgi:hypothetical protein
MEKLKLYKKQIVIGLLLLIGAILGVKMMVNDVEVVEAPVVCGIKLNKMNSEREAQREYYALREMVDRVRN